MVAWLKKLLGIKPPQKSIHPLQMWDFYKEISEECVCGECGQEIERPSPGYASYVFFRWKFPENHRIDVCLDCAEHGAKFERWGILTGGKPKTSPPEIRQIEL